MATDGSILPLLFMLLMCLMLVMTIADGMCDMRHHVNLLNMKISRCRLEYEISLNSELPHPVKHPCRFSDQQILNSHADE